MQYPYKANSQPFKPSSGSVFASLNANAK